MSSNEIVDITLSSIHRQISIPLVARFYSMEEVKELLKDAVNVIDHSIYRYLEEENK